jgi:FAD/FMN-containing dehydrogenase
VNNGSHDDGSPTAPEAPDGFRGDFNTDPEARQSVSTASGVLARMPVALARPADADDVATLVMWAAEHDVALVPRGAGTGMPGGNVGDGVVVDLQHAFRGISPVDPVRRTVRVEPGVTLGEVNRIAARDGLRFPVDPSSGDRCSIGGMIANNAAGAHSVHFGATRDWVESVEVVTAAGRRSTLRRGERPSDPELAATFEALGERLAGERDAITAAWPQVRKNSSGYALREFLETGDAIDLVIGSEGTLALVVEAELRLAPLAGARGLALLEFDDLEAAVAAVEALLPLRPATCEMLDATFLEMVRASGQSPYPLRPGMEAILLVEVEAESGAAVAAALDRVREATADLTSGGASAEEPDRQEALWAIRRAASPIIAARADGRRSMQFIEDSVVPLHALPEYVRALRAILTAHHLPAVIFGHAGDGNLHVNPLVDITSEGWREQVAAVLDEIATVVARLGGTLAGEHGDGRLRAPLLGRIWGGEMVARFGVVKQTLDPQGILNPGVILPLPGQTALDALLPGAP